MSRTRLWERGLGPGPRVIGRRCEDDPKAIGQRSEGDRTAIRGTADGDPRGIRECSVGVRGLSVRFLPLLPSLLTRTLPSSSAPPVPPSVVPPLPHLCLRERRPNNGCESTVCDVLIF
ncbi:hypothetical protein GCM10018791_40400 [Streptomyces zaomyceticus]|nr:hypothetical protein GCM10018791_40400 [Streptomyces zaomyceticus]